MNETITVDDPVSPFGFRKVPAFRNGTVADIADDELLRRAVRSARGIRAGQYRCARWIAVMQVFGLGSTYASQLCRRFDLDPDEEVRRDL